MTLPRTASMRPAIALKAGVDMEMSGEMFGKHFWRRAAVTIAVTKAQLDDAVIRVLKIKFMLGLFERPYVDPARRENHRLQRACPSSPGKSRREGIVLLKNAERNASAKQRNRQNRRDRTECEPYV